MNAKKAMAILADITEPKFGIRKAEAKGFLEAVEKFKPVVECLDEIRNSKIAGFINYVKLSRAFESYRRDVLGEE